MQDDFEAMTGLERVVVLDEARSVEASHVAALRSALSAKEIQATSGYSTDDVVWRLWAATLPNPPRPGDIVRESTGQVWVINSVATTRLGARLISYRCVCTERKP